VNDKLNQIAFMKLPTTSVVSVCVFAALLAATLPGAEDARRKSPIEGIWRWDFIMPDGGKVTPRVKFKTTDGELTGTSRFRLGTDAPVTNITVKGSQVSFDVVRDYEGEPVLTHYSGKLTGDTIKGKVTSKSNGEEQSYEWIAARASGLDGVWTLTVDFGERSFDSRLTLKQEGEKVSGKLGGRGGERDIHRGRFKDNRISFEVERPGWGGSEKSTNRYHGKFSGDKMIGTVEMNRFGGEGRQTNDWDAVRAD
jgi:hypothetical protein